MRQPALAVKDPWLLDISRHLPQSTKMKRQKYGMLECHLPRRELAAVAIPTLGDFSSKLSLLLQLTCPIHFNSSDSCTMKRGENRSAASGRSTSDRRVFSADHPRFREPDSRLTLEIRPFPPTDTCEIFFHQRNPEEPRLCRLLGAHRLRRAAYK